MRLLEGCGGQEGIGCQRRLGNTHERRRAGRELQIRLARINAVLNLVVRVLKLEAVNDSARKQLGIAGLLDANLAHHLTDNNLNVLVVQIYALLTVNLLNFLDQVILNRSRIQNAQDVMRIERTLVELIALSDLVAVLDTDAGGRCELIALGVASLGVDDRDGLCGRALATPRQ